MNASIDPNVLESLCVRGYHCKIFDDPDRAREVNSGQTLICWMGILMDRFDCRGHLTDISPYDADLMDRSEMDKSDPVEAAFQQTLDEERYLELYRDVHEEATLQGTSSATCRMPGSFPRYLLARKAIGQAEERKRAMESSRPGYSAVHFSYADKSPDASPSPDSKAAEDTPNGVNADEEPDELYELPPELRLPYKMEIPQSDKIAQIIERTSQFIAQQGIQMEILIKTKQANNPQFNFLRGDSPLHPFYRFMVSQIKEGRYRPKLRVAKPRPPPSDGLSSHEHPDVAPVISFPKMDISNTSYALLINKLKGKSSEPKNEDKPDENSDGRETNTPDEVIPEPSVINVDQQLTEEQQEEYHRLYESYYNHYFQYYYSHYYHLATANSATPDTTAVANMASSAAQSAASAEAAKSLAHPSQSSVVSPNAPSSSVGETPIKVTVIRAQNDPAVPSEREQAIIDKMAEYVARNGADFESVVRAKDESRFQFLDPSHPLHAYYRKKKREAVLRNAQSQARKVLEAKGISPTTSTATNENGASATATSTISFSLQRPSSKSNLVAAGSSLESAPLDVDCESEEQRERKRAQQILLDKLANEARTKIAEVAKKNKEDEIRAERKRKAELFLSQRRTAEPTVMMKPASPPANQNHKKSESPATKEKHESSRKRDRSHRNDRNKRSRSRSPDRHRHRRY